MKQPLLGTGEKPADFDGTIRLGPLENFIGFNLRLAQDASFQTFAKSTGKPHLKPGRFAALMLIYQNPGLSQMDLSRAIARDKSTVTPLVQALQRDGLVTRTISQRDRRSVTLMLTEAGEHMLSQLLVHALEHDGKLDAIVGDRKKEFLKLLKKVIRELA